MRGKGLGERGGGGACFREKTPTVANTQPSACSPRTHSLTASFLSLSFPSPLNPLLARCGTEINIKSQQTLSPKP